MTLDREKLDKLDPVQANAIVVIQALLDHQTPPGTADKTLEPSLSVEALIVAAAALLETSSDTGMEAQLKRLAGKLTSYARRFRADHRATGQTALEQLGGTSVTKRSIQ